MNFLNHKLFWLLALSGLFFCPPLKTLCVFMTYWQCHVQKVFQQGSTPWHRTLGWCTKWTESFGLGFVGHSMTHTQNSLLATVRKPVECHPRLCIRKTYLGNNLGSFCPMDLCRVEGFVWQYRMSLRWAEIDSTSHIWKGGSVAFSSLSRISMTGGSLFINA